MTSAWARQLSTFFPRPSKWPCQSSRCFASFKADDPDYVRDTFVVHRRGDDSSGSREYLLLPPGATVRDAQVDTSIKAAAIWAHRNTGTIFGARAFHNYPMGNVCLPLLEAALRDCSEQGNQSQALATLYGLSAWIRDCIREETDTVTSEELSKLQVSDPTGFDAVHAIATGVPRPGHSVVGIGTYRDGEKGWRLLSQEFIDLGLAEEVELYKSCAGQVVGIEHLADTKPEYLKTAGGAMARIFFL